jgi:hypothetical protein
MSLSTFFRNPSINNNAIACETTRRRVGLHFRKGLGVYNYKVKPKSYYKDPHSVPLDLKEKLKKQGTDNALRRINTLERLSTKPFGKGTKCGNFRFDAFRVPNYNIPDLTDVQVMIKPITL